MLERSLRCVNLLLRGIEYDTYSGITVEGPNVLLGAPNLLLTRARPTYVGERSEALR